jgi:sensor histidine kinase YesM
VSDAIPVNNQAGKLSMSYLMVKRWRPLLAILAGCLALGAIPGLIELLFTGMRLDAFGISVLHGVIYSCCIGIPCWAAMPEVLCRIEKRSVPVRITAVAGLFGVFGVVGCLVANLLLMPSGAGYLDSLGICLLITYTFGALSLIIFTLNTRLTSAKEELHIRQIAEERERKIAAEARFASLESRVHPHFLFNTLNSISALVQEDPAEAERMIERLSALLRFSLDSELAGVVSLGEELRVVRDYLEIQKVRFGQRLRFRIEVDPAAESQQIPALSVQTLVENSVKYAVGVRSEGADIVVSARLEEGQLRVEVSDDGPGFEPIISMKPGHGLDLLQRRLATLFGPSATLEMTARDGWTRIAISLAA